jgi:hypothetical protein
MATFRDEVLRKLDGRRGATIDGTVAELITDAITALHDADLAATEARVRAECAAELAEVNAQLKSADRIGEQMGSTIAEMISQGLEACEECSGFGRPDCPACHGAGWANVRAIKAESDLADLRAAGEKLAEAMQWIAQQPCQHDAEGASDALPCSETGACITEWCLPCYAVAALAAWNASAPGDKAKCERCGGKGKLPDPDKAGHPLFYSCPDCATGGGA